MRQFITIVSQYIATIFMYSVGIVILGLSVLPGIALCYFLWTHLQIK